MKSYLSAAFLLAAFLAANAGQAVITAGPDNLTINAGSTADFTITATNAKTYQWTFQSPVMLQATNIAGATNSQYKIADTATNQEGVYSVIVRGSTGTNVSASATNTVLQGTIIQFQISGFATGPSNVLVELFDHDKPATVQNFLHYVISSRSTNVFVPGAYSNMYSSGLYSNMFFDRLIPGFVLQGGGWIAQDRTNSNSGLVADRIRDAYPGAYLPGGAFVPSFPQQVDSEFYVGPRVSNTKGTLAMALSAGNADSATSAFFFNLVDNPILDVFAHDEGPFTVFGRVLSGTNVLEYFNNPKAFSKPAFHAAPTRNIFTNGIFDFVLFDHQDTTVLTDLPINYHGTNWLANRNLFFMDFSFPDANAQPVIDVTPPNKSSITYPPSNTILTNGIPLTVRGTAQDDVGVARVYCSLNPLNGAYSGLAGGGNATGATNWSFAFGVVEPGIYEIGVTPQDGAGNLGQLIQQAMTVTAVLTNGVGTVTATNLSTGYDLGDAVGANLLPGYLYALGAQPGPDQLFWDWTISSSSGVALSPNINFYMSTDTVLTAHFISNTLPGGVAFTYPPPGGGTTDGTFSIRGTINGLTNTPISLRCQVLTYPGQLPARSVQETKLPKGTTNWSFPVADLTLGHYYARVTAMDAAGHATVITNDFTAGLPMTVLTAGNGQGTISPNYNGHYLVGGHPYSMTATPSVGSIFGSWSNSVSTSTTTNPVVSFTMKPGLTNTATFLSPNIPGAIAFTYPPLGGETTNGNFTIRGTINGLTNTPVTVKCRLFTYPGQLPATSLQQTKATNTWSFPVANLPLGHYYVEVIATDALGQTTLITNDFTAGVPLNLRITPAGLGTLSSNWTRQFVPIGTSCILTARTNRGGVFVGWSNSAGFNANNPLKFTATTNTTITANFASNYFLNLAGTYNGLFTPADPGAVSPTNSGYYTLTLGGYGAFSFKVLFPGFTNSSSGAFPLYNPAGTASAQIPFTGPDGNPMTNNISFNLTNGSYFLTGSLQNAGFSSALTAYRAATKLASKSLVTPGTNLFFIPGDHSGTNNQPGGDGYASVTLGANGAISLIGWLADNTPFSQSTQVSTNYLQAGAVWPFYASLYGGKGIILGWQSWQSNTAPTNFQGLVAWSKPALSGAFYTNGFELFTNAWSAAYIPPVKGTNYQITFGGASLTNGFTNVLKVAPNGLFTNQPGGQAVKLLVTLNPKTGVLTGSFTPPSGIGTNNLSGAFVTPALGGSGYFLDTNGETGWFEIKAP